jgi:hypothetical protein
MRLFLSLALLLPLAACSGDDGESFATLTECVDDHVEEGLPEANAITHCLVDYPFGDGLTTQAECEEFLVDEGYEDSSVEACTDFIEETGQ